MAAAFVTSVSAYPLATLNLTPTAGNLLVALASGNGTMAASSVSGGGTWVSLTNRAAANTTNGRIFYCLAATGGASTFTLGSPNTDPGWSVHEYSWGAASGTFNTENFGNSSLANPATGASSVNAGDVLVGILADEAILTAPTFTGSWVAARTAQAGHAHWTTDQITAGGSVALTTTRGASSTEVGIFAAFTPASTTTATDWLAQRPEYPDRYRKADIVPSGQMPGRGL